MLRTARRQDRKDPLKKGRGKTKLTRTITDFAREYSKDGGSVDPSTYKKCAKSMLERLSKALIRNNYIFEMPYQMGRIFVGKRKQSPKQKTINWKKTNETGEVVYHKNLHTNRFIFLFYWEKTYKLCKMTNKKMYKFSAVDDKMKRVIGKRGLSEWIQQCAEDPMKKDYNAIEL